MDVSKISIDSLIIVPERWHRSQRPVSVRVGNEVVARVPKDVVVSVDAVVKKALDEQGVRYLSVPRDWKHWYTKERTVALAIEHLKFMAR